MSARLREKYQTDVVPALQKEFGYKRLDDGRKIRVCRKCNGEMDK